MKNNIKFKDATCSEMARQKKAGEGGSSRSGRGAGGSSKKGARKGEERRKGSRGKGEGPGLMSSAGLMRYYDVEESAIKISPMAVILAGILLGVLVLSLQIIYDVWP